MEPLFPIQVAKREAWTASLLSVMSNVMIYFTNMTQNYYACFSLIAACAAANLAIGTRNGEQET